MRKEFLRGYLLALMAEGEFAGLKSPATIFKRAAEVFTGDLTSVAGELANIALEQGARRIGQGLSGKLQELAERMGRIGWRKVWSDMQKDYWRGMDVTAANARRR